MAELGSELLQLAAISRSEFVMCAPFAKQAVVDRLISVVPADVKLTLYTRWRPEEVAAGVSDTGVLQVLRRRGGVVHLHDRLHAKFYRNETGALLGSANLTATALGWIPCANIELLVQSSLEYIADVEQTLKSESIEATEELAHEVDEIARMMSAPLTATAPTDRLAPGNKWVPELRMPADLFAAYTKGLESLSSRSAAAAARDLETLELPVGLNQRQFYALVGHRLHCQPLFQDIDRYLDRPRRFGEVRQHVSRLIDCDRDHADEVWQTVMRWLLEFLPHRYVRDVKRHSEIISRRIPSGGAIQ